MVDGKLYPPLAALRAFEAVGRLGGIRRAAKELMIDHAVVSRHVRSLEASMGVPLIVRSSTGNLLTPHGESFHRKIAAALSIISSATGEVMSGGDLRLSVSCSPDLAAPWLAELIGDFSAENPEIDVDFRPADDAPGRRSEDVDCDIRYLHDWEVDALPSRLHRLEIARPAVFPVAGRDFAARRPPIERAKDLLALPLLHKDGDAEWSNWFSAQGVGPTGRLPGLRLQHARQTLEAARRGQGVALADDMVMADASTADDLVKLEPSSGSFEPVRFGAYTLFAREDRWAAPETLRFRSWLLKKTPQTFAAA